METKRRVFYDENGAFQFNNKAFSECVLNSVCTTLSLDGKQQFVKFKKDIFQWIADNDGVSYDTVKNWDRGLNGPASLEDVKKIAEALGVNYQSFLISLPEYDQTEGKDQAMSESKTNIQTIMGELESLKAQMGQERENRRIQLEKDLVNVIRNGCIELLYDYNAEKMHDIQNAAESSDDSGKMIQGYGEVTVAARQRKLLNLHMEIDKRSMEISSSLRYKLHELLMEWTSFVIDDDFPEEWSLTKDPETGEMRMIASFSKVLNYCGEEDRRMILEDYGETYANEEMILAEKLGFIDSTDLPDDFVEQYMEWYENDDVQDGEKHPFRGDLGYRTFLNNQEKEKSHGPFAHIYHITPMTVIIDMLVNGINQHFAQEFPEYFGDEASIEFTESVEEVDT